MSKSLKLLSMAGLIVAVAACARQQEPAQEEFIVVDPEPISVEPVYKGKYK